MSSPERYGSMLEYLEVENPAALDRLDEQGYPVDKTGINNEARMMYQFYRATDPFVHSPADADRIAADGVDVDVVVHMGCHAIRTPQTIDASMDILEELGYTAVPIGGFTNCCGILDALNGDWGTAERVDAHRFETVEAFEPEYMITECTSCHGTTENFSMEYRNPDFELLSLVELLYQRRDELAEKAVRTDSVTLALHDHYSSFDGWVPDTMATHAREFFRTLPGVDLVEMEHSRDDALPCNYGKDPSNFGLEDLSLEVWREAEAAGADVLLNFWHSCEDDLAWYEPDFPLETRNYTTFVGERLGYEYENVAKKYKRWGLESCIDDIVEHSRPVTDQNGLSESKSRELAEAVFLRDDL